MNKKNIKINEEEHIDIIGIFSNLWSNKRFIISLTGFFFVFSIFYSLSLDNIYRASCIFYPHYEKIDNSSNLRNLAGLAGINLETENTSNIPSSLYPKLISSPIFKSKILNKKLEIDGKKFIYKDYLTESSNLFSIKNTVKKIIYFPLNLIRKFTLRNEQILKKSNNNSKILSISDEEFEIHNLLDDLILLNLNEKEGFLELSVDDKNPQVASQITEEAKNILQESIIEFKVKNIDATYKFVSNQLEIAKNNFYHLQDSLAKFKDKNQNIKSDLFLNRISRIESEYRLSENIYNELAINKEKKAIDVRKNTPIFTVIKPVVIPNVKYEPIRSTIVIFATFFGFIISCFWVVIKNPFFEIISDIKN